MSDVKADKVQDSLGQQCPMPIVYMAKTMRAMAAGQVLEVKADDEGARADVPAWCEQTGNEFLGKVAAEGYVSYFVRKKAATVIVFSGDMDKVFAAFTLATTAAAAGMETTMFFTFWGLKAIQKGNRTGRGLMGRMLGLMNRGGVERLGPSKFNFGGMGRWMFKKMMASKGVTALDELRAAALDLGVHFLACKMSMDVMEIRREDLIDQVEDVVGAAKAIKEASASQINYFI